MKLKRFNDLLEEKSDYSRQSVEMKRNFMFFNNRYGTNRTKYIRDNVGRDSSNRRLNIIAKNTQALSNV